MSRLSETYRCHRRVHVDEVTLEVDPRRHTCPHCGAAFFIALEGVELVGDEQVPTIILTLAA
jgi:transposase